MAHCLLRLTKRSYQRPGGAGTSTSRMDASTSAHRWLGRLAKREAAGRSESGVVFLTQRRKVSKETSFAFLRIFAPLREVYSDEQA